LIFAAIRNPLAVNPKPASFCDLIRRFPEINENLGVLRAYSLQIAPKILAKAIGSAVQSSPISAIILRSWHIFGLFSSQKNWRLLGL